MNFWQNVYVLPPGVGRVIGVDIIELLPVGSDDLFCFRSSPMMGSESLLI
jgi:hypothetical protein